MVMLPDCSWVTNQSGCYHFSSIREMIDHHWSLIALPMSTGACGFFKSPLSKHVFCLRPGQIHACTMGFCKKKPGTHGDGGGVVDTGLMQNACLHRGLMPKPQATKPFYLLHPVHHHMLVEVSYCYEVTQPKIGGVSNDLH